MVKTMAFDGLNKLKFKMIHILKSEIKDDRSFGISCKTLEIDSSEKIELIKNCTSIFELKKINKEKIGIPKKWIR